MATDFRPATVSIVPVSLEEAREWVYTARLIVDRMDGRVMTDAERNDCLVDAFDLAYSVIGGSGHVKARGDDRRARTIAGY